MEHAIRNNSPTVAHSPYCGRPKYGYVDVSQFSLVKQTKHPVKQIEYQVKQPDSARSPRTVTRVEKVMMINCSWSVHL